MKPQLLNISIVILFALAFNLCKANIVFVTGSIRDYNGKPLVNKTVTIKSDTVVVNGNGCFINHTVKTNNQGIYFDTINCCVGIINKIYTSIVACNNLKINYIYNTTATNTLVTSNFTVGQSSFIVVSGFVKDFYGNAIKNKLVRLKSDSTSGCSLNRIKYTDTNGFYKDTLQCCNQITKVFTIVSNCSGQAIQKENNINSATSSISSNFSISNKTKIALSGFVKDANGKAIANKPVSIKTDSSSECVINHTVLTNANGFYIDSINCCFGVNKVLISIVDCNGNLVQKANSINNIATTLNNDFVDCISIATCKANFKDSSNFKTFYFTNISTSSKPIGKYKWTYSLNGKPSVLFSTLRNPKYVFADTGNYNICLTIITSDSVCSNTFCKEISVNDSNVVATICKANFTFTRNNNSISFLNTSTSNKVVDFNKWTYSLNGSNPVVFSTSQHPNYNFIDTGLYNICLTITSSDSLCSSSFCSDVFVRDSIIPNTCKAVFYNKTNNKTISLFDYSTSTKSISSYSWTVSANGATPQNFSSLQNPSLTVKDTGRYLICLTITNNDSTCSNTYCNWVYIKDSLIHPKIIGINIQNLFPNPATNILNIDFSNNKSNDNISVIISNTFGATLLSKNVTTLLNNDKKNIDISSLSKGTYILTLVNSSGSRKSKTFIKQ